MKALIVAEKPSLARAIKDALYREKWKEINNTYESDNYIIVAAFGSLYNLYDIDDYFGRDKTKWNLEELPFVPNIYKYKIKTDKNGKVEPKVRERVDLISSLIKRKDVTLLLNTGDADSAGTKIIKQVIDYNNPYKKKVKRLYLQDQSDLTIRTEINNLREMSEFEKQAEEEFTRETIDWNVGIQYTRLISLICSGANKSNTNSIPEDNNNTNKKILLPCGRVLSSIVKFIYDRKIEQENFIPTEYFNISLNIEGISKPVVLKDSLHKKEEFLIVDNLISKLNQGNIYVSNIEKEVISKMPKKLFSLTTLLNTSNRELKINNKATKEALKVLYERGFVTYPRTDTEYLSLNSSDRISKVIEVFKELGESVEFKEKKTVFDDEKIGSHEALTPTTKIPDLNTLTDKEKAVYTLIKNRFLSNFAPESKVEYNYITISNTNSDNIAELKEVKILEYGHLKYNNYINEVKYGDFQKGDRIKGLYTSNLLETKPQANVNVEELNNYLENPLEKDKHYSDDEDLSNDEIKYKNIMAGLEIGTVATRVDIIENAKDYGYIEEDKGVYNITPKGRYYIETSNKLGISLDTKFNVKIGMLLKEVLNGKKKREEVVSMIEREITEKITKAKLITVDGFVEDREAICKCPICEGQVFESQKAFFCEGIKDKKCHFMISKEKNLLASCKKNITKSIVKSLCTKKQTLVSGLTSKAGNKFDAAIKLEFKDNWTNIVFISEENRDDLVICPRCKKGHIKESEKGFYCSNINSDNCRYFIYKQNSFLKERGINVTKSLVTKLITKGAVSATIKNKNSTEQKCKLSLEDTGKYVNIKVVY